MSYKKLKSLSEFEDDKKYKIYGIREHKIKIKNDKMDIDKKTCNEIDQTSDYSDENRAKRIKCKCTNVLDKKLNGIFDKDSNLYNEYKNSIIYKKSKDKFKDANAYLWYYLNNYTNEFKYGEAEGNVPDSEKRFLITKKNNSEKCTDPLNNRKINNNTGVCKNKDKNVYLFEDKEFKKFNINTREDLKKYNIVDELNFLSNEIIKNRIKFYDANKNNFKEINKRNKYFDIIIRVIAIIFIIFAFVPFLTNMYQFFNLSDKHISYFYNYLEKKINIPCLLGYIGFCLVIFIIIILYYVSIQLNLFDNKKLSDDNTYAIINDNKIYNKLNPNLELKEEFSLGKKCPAPLLKNLTKEDEYINNKKKMLELLAKKNAKFILISIFYLLLCFSFYLMNITSKIITISQARNIKLKLNIVFYLFSFLFLIIIIYLFNSIYTTDTTKKEDLNKLSINTENNNNCEYISNSSQGKVNDSIFKDGYIGITIFIMFALMALYILLRFNIEKKLSFLYLPIYILVFACSGLFVFFLVKSIIFNPIIYLIYLIGSRILTYLSLMVISGFHFAKIGKIWKTQDQNKNKKIQEYLNTISIFNASIYSYPLELTSIFTVNMHNRWYKNEPKKQINIKNYKIKNLCVQDYKDERKINLGKSEVQYELLSNLTVPSGIPWNFPGFNLLKIISLAIYIGIKKKWYIDKKKLNNYSMNFIPKLEDNESYTLRYTSSNSQVFNSPFQIFYAIYYFITKFKK